MGLFVTVGEQRLKMMVLWSWEPGVSRGRRRPTLMKRVSAQHSLQGPSKMELRSTWTPFSYDSTNQQEQKRSEENSQPGKHLRTTKAIRASPN